MWDRCSWNEIATEIPKTMNEAYQTIRSRSGGMTWVMIRITTCVLALSTLFGVVLIVSCCQNLCQCAISQVCENVEVNQMSLQTRPSLVVTSTYHRRKVQSIPSLADSLDTPQPHFRVDSMATIQVIMDAVYA